MPVEGEEGVPPPPTTPPPPAVVAAAAAPKGHAQGLLRAKPKGGWAPADPGDAGERAMGWLGGAGMDR